MTAIQEVESTDDTLAVLLAHLPARSIFRFRCVCTRWGSITSQPYFYQTYCALRKSRPPQMVAYIHETFWNLQNEYYRRYPRSIIVAPVARGLQIMGSTMFSRSRTDALFVNSSNGLILVQEGNYQLTICNPITKRMISVFRPLSPKFYLNPAVALVCEVNSEVEMRSLVPNYKLVVAGKQEGHYYLTLNTFCSMTGTWTTSIPNNRKIFNDQIEKHSCSPLVVDGVIHWFTYKRRYLVVCHVGSGEIQLVGLPSECLENYCLKVARSSAEDELQLCMHMQESWAIKIWTMPAEVCDSYRSRSRKIPSMAWKLMHLINLHPYPVLIEPVYQLITFVGSDRTIAYTWLMYEYGTRKTPYVAFAMPSQQTLRILNFAEMSWETHILGLPSGWQGLCIRSDYTPYMEALSLSSYAL